MSLTAEQRNELTSFANKIRMYALYCMAKPGQGHVGGALSAAEIIAYLYGKEMRYNPKDPKWSGRDLFIMSKGHAGPALYSALAIKGFFPEEWLGTLNKGGTDLPSHCDKNHTPGIDMSTGSLGQGLSVACGAAIGAKLNGENKRIYAMIGDGETDEGQNWEAAMFAASRKLDTLIAITDRNKLQLDGFVDNVLPLGDLAAKWKAFGWQVEEANGHDMDSIDEAFCKCHNDNGKPKMIIMNTIKAKGMPRLENQGNCHHATLTVDEVKEIYNGEVPSWLK